MFHTIAEIKEANLSIGHHFFSRQTMDFWGSLVVSEAFPVEDGAYFVTSEYASPEREQKCFTVRFAHDIGDVRMAGGFPGYPTKHKAINAAKVLQQSHTCSLAIFANQRPGLDSGNLQVHMALERARSKA